MSLQRRATLRLTLSSVVFSILLSILRYTNGQKIKVERDCVEQTKNYGNLFLTEYPGSHSINESVFELYAPTINFLEFGDECNPYAEVRFRAELEWEYNNSRKDQSDRKIWEKLNLKWNEWRLHTIDGIHGDRICNPRQILGCHLTLHKCYCVQNFVMSGMFKEDHHAVIQTRHVHNEILLFQNKIYSRVVCKSVEGGDCDWKVPFLFSCQLQCLGGQTCIGQSGGNTKDRKICRTCDVTKSPHTCETDSTKYKRYHRSGSIQLFDSKLKVMSQVLLALIVI